LLPSPVFKSPVIPVTTFAILCLLTSLFSSHYQFLISIIFTMNPLLVVLLPHTHYCFRSFVCLYFSASYSSVSLYKLVLPIIHFYFFLVFSISSILFCHTSF
jgi:hypothetical protein